MAHTLNHNLDLNPVAFGRDIPLDVEVAESLGPKSLNLNPNGRRIAPASPMPQFDHEKLNVYQAAIRFVGWSSNILEEVPKGLAVHNQLDRASTSIPLNIAEGNGKHTPADRCRFFDNARGSALECAACLDVLVAKR